MRKVLIIQTETIKQIIKLGRLHFLAGGFLLYTMGVLLAVISGADFNISLFLFGYAIMMPAHLAVSYSNNYFDIDVDRYNKPDLFSGGTKILQQKTNLRKFCKYFAITLMIITMINTVLFITIYSFSPIFLVFVLFGTLLGWFYSAPPLKLAYRGLGEISNMITFGVLMPGIGYWVISGSLNLFFIVFAIPFILYGLDFIITVESPDMQGDKKGNKKTLVVKMGRKKTYPILLISIIISTIYFFILSISNIYTETINLYILTFLSLIPIVVAIVGYTKKPWNNEKSAIISKANISALILFILLTNIFLSVSIIFS